MKSGPVNDGSADPKQKPKIGDKRPDPQEKPQIGDSRPAPEAENSEGREKHINAQFLFPSTVSR